MSGDDDDDDDGRVRPRPPACWCGRVAGWAGAPHAGLPRCPACGAPLAFATDEVVVVVVAVVASVDASSG